VSASEAARVADRIARLAGRLETIKAGGGDAGVLAAGLAGALTVASGWVSDSDTETVFAHLRFSRAQAASELLGAIEASLAEVTP
jgi:hypothetical protein